MMMQRLALYGPRGAGKSTVSTRVKEVLGDEVQICHSAEPIYDLQARIYAHAGRQRLTDRQDGRILAESASLIRSLNPDALAESVVRQANTASSLDSPAKMFLCDDSTPFDRDVLRRNGFEFLHVWAPRDQRRGRRRLRGDVESASDTNDPDVPLGGFADYQILNLGTLDALRDEVSALLRGMFGDTNGR